LSIVIDAFGEINRAFSKYNRWMRKSVSDPYDRLYNDTVVKAVAHSGDFATSIGGDYADFRVNQAHNESKALKANQARNSQQYTENDSVSQGYDNLSGYYK